MEETSGALLHCKFAIFAQCRRFGGVGLIDRARGLIGVAGTFGVVGVSGLVRWRFYGIRFGLAGVVLSRVMYCLVFTILLLLARPVTGVDGLSKGLQFRKGIGFANTCYFIFDACRKSVVELMSEWSVAPMDLMRNLEELHNVLREALTAPHSEFRKLGFRVFHRVIGAKVRPEFLLEGVVVNEPFSRKNAGCGDLRFEVIECCSCKIGQRKVNFGFIIEVGFRTI